MIDFYGIDIFTKFAAFEVALMVSGSSKFNAWRQIAMFFWSIVAAAFIAASLALSWYGSEIVTAITGKQNSQVIGKNTVHDVHRYGVLTLQDIIKYSSNIGAVKISEKVGPEKLHHTLRLFGFGQKTGIDSPAETTGLLMPHKHWTDIDTAAISFGHGVSVSAVQLITAFAAIANDGVLMRPRIVQAITDQQGQILQQFAPEAVAGSFRRRRPPPSGTFSRR